MRPTQFALVSQDAIKAIGFQNSDIGVNGDRTNDLIFEDDI